ncbi:protein EXORDIUM-like 2 [Cryptomeria japonica]|uniref:protein EXORDIUM-like 2 n=1 Tax=Cryptomeria japonica TaxID=3369 RepID=UPI0027DAA5A0|nr:protein EXORDIUM-like 2 [Cryptomeria japonica]
MTNIDIYKCWVSIPKLCCIFLILISSSMSAISFSSPEVVRQGRKLSALVPSAPLVLQYHKGPLLTGPDSINVYILWYGKFTPSQKAIITDFVSSLGATNAIPNRQPSVSSWWATTKRYSDSTRKGVSGAVKIGGQASNGLYSLGKNLKRSQIAILVKGALAKRLFPLDNRGVYLVLTAADVYVERFCMNSCGFHDSIPLSKSTTILFGWVGNSGVQCPGQCAWPFAAPLYGPPTPPLIPPNGDVGVDGMIINIAAVVAGTATNPFNTGYYQGSALAPEEAVTACSGIFGKGAYPGYAGDLLVDKRSKASYNAYGINNREFLVPGIWEPLQRACKTTIS